VIVVRVHHPQVATQFLNHGVHIASQIGVTGIQADAYFHRSDASQDPEKVSLRPAIGSPLDIAFGFINSTLPGSSAITYFTTNTAQGAYLTTRSALLPTSKRPAPL